jgi:hypothetical protein
MTNYTFPCGCSFPIIGEAKHKFEIPRLKIDLYNIPYACEAAWDIIRTGNTTGIFQVETPLGQSWSKKVSPDNLEHIGAIGAILRPGCLRSITDGKSMTAHYADRKNDREEVKSYHPIVDACLRETYNLLVYQEQAMAIAVAVAAFSLEEADNLRKAMGKKLASEMAKVKLKFFEKAKIAAILNDAQIEEVFGWIQESQRYSFNKSILADTIVETKDGLKTIEDLKIGEYVNSPDGFIEVLNKYDHGEQEVYEITMESGKSITCTMQHKFLCEDSVIRPLFEIIENNHKIMCEDD